MAGRDAAPAGVVRSCTPGRTPEQPRRLLSGRLGSGHRETRKRKDVAGAPTSAGFFFFRACSARPSPRLRGRKTDVLSRARPKSGTGIALASSLSARPSPRGAGTILPTPSMVHGARVVAKTDTSVGERKRQQAANAKSPFAAVLLH